MRHFFLRDRSKFPVACVASEMKDDIVRFSLSIHNPMDIYSRSRGRMIAIERLKAGKVQGSVSFRPKMVKMDVLFALVKDVRLPLRVREAAQWQFAIRRRSQTDVTLSPGTA